MRLYAKIKVEQAKIMANKLSKEVQKLAFAVVIVEFMLAGAFAVIVNQNWTIQQIAPVEAKTTQHSEPQATQKQEAKPSIDENKEIKDSIWNRESTRGQHNYSKCEQAGTINGIGYAIPGNGKFICFKDHAEEMAMLEKWLNDHKAQGLTETEILCHYSGNNYQECKK